MLADADTHRNGVLPPTEERTAVQRHITARRQPGRRKRPLPAETAPRKSLRLNGHRSAERSGRPVALTQSSAATHELPPTPQVPLIACSFQPSAASVEALDISLTEFLQQNSLLPDQIEARFRALEDVRQIVRELFDNHAQAVCFGSLATNLMISRSDVDVTLLGLGSDTPALARKALAVIRDHLTTQTSHSVENLRFLSHATVPLLKFLLNGVPIDLCVGVTGGLTGLDFISRACRDLPLFHSLVLVLKTWKFHQDMCDTHHGYLGSFLLQLLIVAHLRLSPQYLSSPGHSLVTFFHFLAMWPWQTHAIHIRPDFEVTVAHRNDPCQTWNENETARYTVPFVTDPIDKHNNAARSCYKISIVQARSRMAYLQLVTHMKATDLGAIRGDPMQALMRPQTSSTPTPAYNKAPELVA